MGTNDALSIFRCSDCIGIERDINHLLRTNRLYNRYTKNIQRRYDRYCGRKKSSPPLERSNDGSSSNNDDNNAVVVIPMAVLPGILRQLRDKPHLSRQFLRNFLFLHLATSGSRFFGDRYRRKSDNSNSKSKSKSKPE